jgi:hypothetical protein
MIIYKTGKKSWENRHETFRQPISDLYQLGNEPNLSALNGYNDTTAGLQLLVKQAIKAGTTLRALGAGWSWTKVTTPGKGIMLDTKMLNTRFTLNAASLNAAWKPQASQLFFVQCGMGIWELNEYLRSKGLSLKTTGASNGQTIAGAIGTGAHGSAIDVGAVQDAVLGLHLVTGANKHVYLQKKSNPVVLKTFTDKLGAELIEDDDTFSAALVSFGSFGLVHGVLLEAEPLFLLEGYMRRLPYDASLQQVMNTLDFNQAVGLPYGQERPYHFSSYLNPYDMDKGAYVTVMYKRNYAEPYLQPAKNPNGLGPGDDAPCFIGRMLQVLPALVPTAVNKLLAASITPFEKQTGTIGEIFNNTTLHGKLQSAAIGLPIAYVTQVADLLLKLNKTKGPFAGLFAFRYVKQSQASLAFTRYSHTCICELDGVFSDRTNNFYTAVWDALEKSGIPFTFHWGKVNELNRTRLRNMYGADLDKWLTARNTLLDAKAQAVFNNPLMKKWGLV